nr:right-handed parallel beta-helix repeat-containing protein [uncultured Pseudodesulfovibrio sp.]
MRYVSKILCGIMLSLTIPISSMATEVGTLTELHQALDAANNGSHKEIILQDGKYVLQHALSIQADGVMIRSKSGNRDTVWLVGPSMDSEVGHVFHISGSDITLRDMTIGRVANHAIQIHGELNAHRPCLANLHILDCREQMIKISTNLDAPNMGCMGGIIEDCLFEYTAKIGPHFYIGGIDAHNARDWTVRNCEFRNIASPDKEAAEYAIHFWSGSRGTQVENNQIIDCDRGIGFGMGDSPHFGGVIRNNIITHGPQGRYADVGISLESASGAIVTDNQIFFQHKYPNAIEYRFPATKDVVISNTSTNRAVVSRDGGQAIVH